LFGAGSNEIYKTSTAVEFGKKDSGVGLSLSAGNPPETRPDDTRVTTSLPQNSASIAAHPHFNESQLHNRATGAGADIIYIYIDCLTRREEEELNWKAREDGASERKKKRDAQRRQLWDGEGREGGDGYINNEAGEILIPMDLVRSACGFGMGWTRA
jgi:hypothetical protein